MIEFANPNHGPCRAAEAQAQRVADIRTSIERAQASAESAKSKLAQTPWYRIISGAAAKTDVLNADFEVSELDISLRYEESVLGRCVSCSGAIPQPATTFDGEAVTVRICRVFPRENA